MDGSNSTDRQELVTEQRSTLPTIGSTVDERTRRAEFAKAVSPALVLVAPTGMSGDERKAWLAAADMALSEYPPDVIALAARAAMLKADHPRQIVPLIAEAADEEMLCRKREADRLEFMNRYANQPALPPPPPEPEISQEERAEVAKLMKGLASKLSANQLARETK